MGRNKTSTVYPDGTQMTYEYDSLGRLKKKSDRNGNGITYGYDCMGRVQTVTGSTGQQKSYTYDVMGNVSAVTDADGNTTRYAYTFNGRLREVTDALGSKTEYTYDKADRLVCICQHGQEGDADRTTEYERDAFGQVRCIRDAAGGEEYFRYDSLGRLAEKTDREGLITAYSYTADGMPESILYGDGRRAELEYTPLRHLAVVKDWLGETRIERDSQDTPVSITDHNGRTVHYEWGSMGQRQGMTYPDGTRVSWTYDGLLRPTQMKRTAEGRETLWTDYQYDRQGRLSEKKSSGGYDTRWHYNETGLLEELCQADASGILDRFRYTYDAMGNRTMATKERRGLPEESGVYRYIYDGLQRLTGVEKDGKPLRSYQYDAFGNRTELEDHAGGTRSTYGYDALNRLLEQEIRQGENTVIHKTYTYDKRGNLTGEYQDGGLLHGYAYDSMNRLQKAWDSQGAEAEYFYNALGQRTGRCTGGGMEEYLLDLTKPYHNLLELRRGEHRQTFYWDMNVSAMEDENRIIQYYLSDELGSPLRVLYRNGNGDAYGYDEFGVDLYDPEAEQYGGKRYSRQGERQPFGYTGYRHDDISGTYFAQAREYQPEVGRFVAEDVIKGRGAMPRTLNQYGYCLGNPLRYVDFNGKEEEEEEETAYVFYIDDFEREADWQTKQLEANGVQVIQVNLSDADGDDQFDENKERAQMFMKEWNSMDDSKVDTVYIFSHGTERMLQFENGSKYNGLTIDGWNKAHTEEVAGNLNDLSEKNIDTLYIQACNTGLIDFWEVEGQNAASILSSKISNGITYAWDGSVAFGPNSYIQGFNNFFGINYDLEARLSKKQDHFNEYMKSKKSKEKPKGQIQYQNGKCLECE